MPSLNDLTEAKVINERMARLWGHHLIVNKPNYQIVFADEQLTEKRCGTFDLYAGDIFLREETGIREVEKYPWVRGQWIIESLVPNPHPDVYDGDYIYNIIWAFPENLPLNWNAILKLMNAIFLNLSQKKARRTEQDDYEIEKRRIKEAKIRMRHELENIPEKGLNFDNIVILGHGEK